MMKVFHIKQNDTAPAIGSDLLDAAKNAVDLTGATVRFNMRSEGGELVVDNQIAVVTNAVAGAVRYDWQPEDTAIPGICYAEFEVTYANGNVETFPNSSNIKVRVAPEVG
jgi:hypothetical protein